MKQKICGVFAGALFASTAFAAVSAEEAKQLGGATLTAWGAEKAGNKEGTIPAYTGERLAAPAGWDRKKQGYPDVWGEKPLFSITAQNADKYADKLDGMIHIFKRYPNYRMDVYPTHRTATFPKQYLDNTVKNASVCKGANDDQKLEGCYPGFPFPIPKTGRQAMWNKLMSNGGNLQLRSDNLPTWVTPSNGVPVLQTENYLTEQFPILDPSQMDKPMTDSTPFFLARVDVVGPARAAGNKYIFEEKVDLNNGARAWAYIPGQRRVKLSPDLAYDTPSPLSGGTQLMDEGQGFFGALDRFDYKLVGKKEKFIMYNEGMMTDPRICPDNKITANKNFPNPDCVRWELHRVWVVESKLKPEFRHAYKRRVFFWDEDTYAGSIEGYDASGALYRLTNVIHYPIYEGGYANTSSITSDLLTGGWSLQGSYGKEGAAFYPTKPNPLNFFSAEALASEGIR